MDTGLYYGGHGDREAVAHRDMDQETRLREGKDSYRDTWDTPAGFEKHTKVRLNFNAHKIIIIYHYTGCIVYE